MMSRLFQASWSGLPVASLAIFAIGGSCTSSCPCQPGPRRRRPQWLCAGLVGLLADELAAASFIAAIASASAIDRPSAPSISPRASWATMARCSAVQTRGRPHTCRCSSMPRLASSQWSSSTRRAAQRSPTRCAPMAARCGRSTASCPPICSTQDRGRYPTCCSRQRTTAAMRACFGMLPTSGRSGRRGRLRSREGRWIWPSCAACSTVKSLIGDVIEVERVAGSPVEKGRLDGRGSDAGWQDRRLTRDGGRTDGRRQDREAGLPSACDCHTDGVDHSSFGALEEFRWSRAEIRATREARDCRCNWRCCASCYYHRRPPIPSCSRRRIGD
jgi:hypothetical protein